MHTETHIEQGGPRYDAIDDLGLDDFLAKLKFVTSRVNAHKEEEECKSEVARLDEELAQLNSGTSSNFVSKPKVPALMQRSARPPQVPPPVAARSPRDPVPNFARNIPDMQRSAPTTAGTLIDLPRFESDTTPRPPPVPSDTLPLIGANDIGAHKNVVDMPVLSSQLEMRSKISRIQDALQESRQTRLLFAPGSMQGDKLMTPNAPQILQRSPQAVQRSAAPSGPDRGAVSYDAPVPGLGKVSQVPPSWQLNNGSPQRPPPKLLQRDANMMKQPAQPQQQSQQQPQQQPSMFVPGELDKPVPEYLLLQHVSSSYHGDPSLQTILWDMVSDGRIQTPRQLMIFADGHMRKRENSAPTYSSPITSPGSHQQGFVSPHQGFPQQQASVYPQQASQYPQQGLNRYQQKNSQSLDFPRETQRKDTMMPPNGPGMAPTRHQQKAIKVQYDTTAFGLPSNPMQHGMKQSNDLNIHNNDLNIQNNDFNILSRSVEAINKLTHGSTTDWSQPQKQYGVPKLPQQMLQQSPKQMQMQHIPSGPGQVQPQQQIRTQQAPQPYGVNPRLPAAAQNSESTVSDL